MNTHTVIGGLYGDEGKGSLVNHLAKLNKKSIVVRFNGGPQAGHTVVLNGRRHVFSHFGSATLQGVPTLWSEYCYTEPGALVEEYKLLKHMGVTPQMFMHTMSPVITPYDMMANRLDQSNINHGTCGIGFGKAVERHENHPYKMYVGDLYGGDWVVKQKLNNIMRYYVGKIDKWDIRLTNALAQFHNYVRQLRKFKTISLVTDEAPMWNYENCIFEGSQGILLDKDVGFFPHVTRSNTTLENYERIMTKGPIHDDEDIYVVVRSYLTRHGAGPMSEHNHQIKLINNHLETNVHNTYQGPLRVRAFNLDLVKYSLSILQRLCLYQNGHSRRQLVITCMDQHDGDIPYVHNGELKSADPDEFVDIVKEDTEWDVMTSHGPEFVDVEHTRKLLTK